MYLPSVFSISVVFLALCTLGTATSFGVYHLSARQAGSTCKSVKVPSSLCTSCKLKPFKGRGNDVYFPGSLNRFDIYNVSAPGCEAAITSYVNMNECDSARKMAWQQRNTIKGRKALAYFLYAVCETCCDCVPIGSDVSEYDERQRDGTLLNTRRGNCAAHFHYDTCRIWPEVGRITSGNNQSPENQGITPWCNDFRQWLFSPFSRRWLRNNMADGITDAMARGMEMILDVTQCTEETQWKNCVAMEKAQERV